MTGRDLEKVPMMTEEKAGAIAQPKAPKIGNIAVRADLARDLSRGWVGVKDAAELLAISPKTVCKRIRDGHRRRPSCVAIPTIRALGKPYRIPADFILSILEGASSAK